MDVTPIIPAGRQVIETYGERRFRISGEVYGSPVLVFPDRVLTWDVSGIEDVGVETLRPVLSVEPSVEILLLGSGLKMALLPSALRRDLRQAGIVMDVMDTGAACRTYNVLLSEERRVAAALLPV